MHVIEGGATKSIDAYGKYIQKVSAKIFRNIMIYVATKVMGVQPRFSIILFLRSF
jgi:hypothetical protein